MNFLGQDNKYLLWSVMQESDVFKNIPSNKYNEIAQMFENVISNHEPYSNLIETNKEVINVLLSKIHAIANTQSLSNTPIEVVYRSETREKEWNNRMQEKKQEMDGLLQPPAPKEVSFADSNIDDVPIGDNMDILLQDILKSRERALDVPVDMEAAKKWINIESDIVLDARQDTLPDARQDTLPDARQDTLLDARQDTLLDAKADILTRFKKKNINTDIMNELSDIKKFQEKLLNLIESQSSYLDKYNDILEKIESRLHLDS